MIAERDFVPLIKRHANKLHRSFMRSGLRSFDAEDIEQEFWITWTRARDTFDETRGVPFEAYLVEGLRQTKHDLRRRISRRFEEEHGTSLDTPVEEGFSLHDTMAADDEPIDRSVERDQQVEYLCRHLSPRAAAYVRLLYQQPRELHEEFVRVKHRAEYASQLGVAHFSSNSITSGMVFKAMGASRPERTKIREEINKTLERLK